jgi:hypothetical protein
MKPRFVRVREYPVPKPNPKWDWYQSHTYIVRVGQVFRCPHCGQLYVFGIRSTAFGSEARALQHRPIACVHIGNPVLGGQGEKSARAGVLLRRV